MQYKPLTPSQQEKYDKRNGRVTAETEEIPGLEAYAEQQEEQDEPETESTEAAAEIPEDEPVREEAEQPADQKGSGKKIGDTMRLDEALKKTARS